jgi:hypothetical protein
MTRGHAGVFWLSMPKSSRLPTSTPSEQGVHMGEVEEEARHGVLQEVVGAGHPFPLPAGLADLAIGRAGEVGLS